MTSSSKRNVGTTGAYRDPIVGLFRSQADAERAIQGLKDAGIYESRIGVAMQDRDGKLDLAEGNGGTPGSAGGGALAGAWSGGILGGIVGLLAGVEALAIPGVGPIIAGGPLASALAGSGNVAGELVGTLVRMGVPEGDARYFDQGFRDGGVLVSALAGSRISEAREILRASGADLGSAGRAAAEAADRFVEDEADHSDTGGEAWRGSERRYHDDLSYAGPERRFSPVN